MPRALAAVLLLVVALPLLARPGPIPLPEDEPYVHAPSGFTFPPDLNTFTRVTAFRYDDRGENVSVGYNDFALQIIFTVYVYPASKRTLDQQFEDAKKQLVEAHPDAKLLSEGPWELKQGGRTFPGRRAAYAFKTPIAGQPREVVSEAFLLQNGDRLVKYRASVPKEKHEPAADRIQKLIESLTLPDPKPAPKKK